MAEPRRDTTAELSLQLRSQARLLASVRGLVNGFAQRLGFDEMSVGQLCLAVDEAICNIINHGYHQDPNGLIWLHIQDQGGSPPSIQIVIEDRARQVDPDTIRSRDLDEIRPGGLGVHLIRKSMDEVLYEKRSDGAGMRLTMRKTATNGTPEAASAPPSIPREERRPS